IEPPVGLTEDLFRFVDPVREYLPAKGRISSECFRDRELSVNRGSVWPLKRHEELLAECRERISGWGTLSFTLEALRSVATPTRDEIEVIPKPVEEDKLLGIPNPAHCNVSRQVTDNEASRMVKLEKYCLHRPPAPPR